MQPFKSINDSKGIDNNKVAKITLPGVILPNIALVSESYYGILKLSLIIMTNMNTFHSISLI